MQSNTSAQYYKFLNTMITSHNNNIEWRREITTHKLVSQKGSL
jgi:hypothetical protein